MTYITGRELDEDKEKTNAYAQKGGAHPANGRMYIGRRYGCCLFDGFYLRGKGKALLVAGGLFGFVG